MKFLVFALKGKSVLTNLAGSSQYRSPLMRGDVDRQRGKEETPKANYAASLATLAGLLHSLRSFAMTDVKVCVAADHKRCGMNKKANGPQPVNRWHVVIARQ